MEVISLLKISSSHSRSVHCRGAEAVTVSGHVCGRLEIREKTGSDGQSDKVGC